MYALAKPLAKNMKHSKTKKIEEVLNFKKLSSAPDDQRLGSIHTENTTTTKLKINKK